MARTVVRWAALPSGGDASAAARRLLAATVAEVTGCDVGDVTLRQRCHRCGGPHGRPTVAVRGKGGPGAAISHAGDLVMVAVARGAVGVDVEPVSGDRPVDALRSWVRLEALLKATGHGLDVDPSLVELSPPGETPRLLSWRGPGRVPRARFADLDVAGHVAAVATLGRRRVTVDGRAVPVS